MTAREWALPTNLDGKIIGDRQHIKNVSNRYRSMSSKEQKSFNERQKRNWQCEFCINHMTASSLSKENKVEAHFKAVSPNKNNWKKNCTGDCEVDYSQPSQHINKISQPETSDRRIIQEIECYNCLEFLDSNVPKPENRQETDHNIRSENKNKGSGTARTIASVVRYYYNKRDIAAYQPIKIPNREHLKDTYRSIFQPLKAKEDQEYCGWQIYYGQLKFKEGMDDNKENILFNLFSYENKDSVTIAIDKQSSFWSDKKISAIKNVYKEAHLFQSKKYMFRKNKV